MNRPAKKQQAAARANGKRAAAAAKEKGTIAHLPKKMLTALGKQAAKSGQTQEKVRV